MSPRLNPHVLSCPVEDFRPIRAAQVNPAFISLAVADPYKSPSPHVLAAYHEAISAGHTRYGPCEGLPVFRQAISRKLARQNDIVADPDSEVLVTHGAGHGFLLALIALVQPGDEVLTPDPSFPLNFGTTRMLGATPVSCPILGDDGMAALPERLERAITSRTRLIIVHNPNNPTGDRLSREVLEGIARVACAHDLFVLSDEAYERFIYDNRTHVSLASLPGMRERTVTLFSFSKDYCLSGLRVGYLAASAQIAAAIARVQQNDGSGASPAAQMAALAALEGPRTDLDSWVAEFAETRRVVVEALNLLPGVHCPLPEGGYFVFPKVAGAEDPVAFCRDLLEQAQIGLAPGTWYGTQGRGRVRLCYAAVPRPRIEEAVARLAAVLDRRAMNTGRQPHRPT